MQVVQNQQRIDPIVKQYDDLWLLHREFPIIMPNEALRAAYLLSWDWDPITRAPRPRPNRSNTPYTAVSEVTSGGGIGALKRRILPKSRLI